VHRFGRVRASVQLSVFAGLVVACLLAWAAVLPSHPGAQSFGWVEVTSVPAPDPCADPDAHCRTVVTRMSLWEMKAQISDQLVTTAAQADAQVEAKAAGRAALTQSWYRALIGQDYTEWWR
jgi:hypothetical protein